ncbi:MAG: recombination regulator RecX, partial [Candidatus Omnitrophica bacterium]|nr:recombination regulator RecX [Candidatus Omnitrophota bacterium]
LFKAKNIVYQLLNFRERSEKEIRDKLNTKGISGNIIGNCINYFKDLDLINDRQFAKKWINYRLNKPFGISRIRMELKQKGVKSDILEEELAHSQDNFDELSIVIELAQRRLEKYKNIDDQKARQRLYGYLTRRGFSGNSIRKTLTELFKNHDDNK